MEEGRGKEGGSKEEQEEKHASKLENCLLKTASWTKKENRWVDG